MIYSSRHVKYAHQPNLWIQGLIVGRRHPTPANLMLYGQPQRRYRLVQVRLTGKEDVLKFSIIERPVVRVEGIETTELLVLTCGVKSTRV